MLLILLFINTSQAAQLSFTKKKIEQGYQFHYQWLDSNSIQQSMNFTLSNEGLFERFRYFKSYQDNYAQKSIFKGVKKKLRQNPIAHVRIRYRKNNDQFYIEVKGTNEKQVAKAYQLIAKIEEEVTAQYLAENYYQLFTDHTRNTGIKVNHVTIANDSVADLKPLKSIILDHFSMLNIRKVTNYVLGFVQSIPYSTLESRLTSSGAGFNTPLQVLWENQGDCDSKMTLTASLLRLLMPRIKMALIFVDNHAFIGINIPAKPGEVTLMNNSVRYVLAEPTGPSLLPLGTLPPESELAINQGQYTVQDFHELITE
ncbi:hypothetical protein [Colwellia sp. E2M01]|uniref:hypothetical protein n=1 Tax=Colwellia sp. E2M01 TaxID=2841561 RepID=UPI001C09EAD2|nr:hypothetical protein [Colwellia sp. E2M01]MBU2870230.1 hypothetical protein [Colwellia sp. E2M01]